jgi:WD40 repeat protein
MQDYGGNAYHVAISPDGGTLAAVGPYYGAKLWDFSSGRPIAHIGSKIRGWCNQIIFSPDGSVLACINEDVWLYNLRSQQVARLPHAARERCVTVAFSPKGNLLASGDTQGALKVWNAKTGRPVGPFEKQGSRQTGGCFSVGFSHDGADLAAAGHGSSELLLWETATGELLETWDEPGAVNALCTSPTGPFVASGGQQDEYRIRIRDLASGEILARLAGHEDHLRSLAFSPDGTMIVSGSRDKTVRIWELIIEP